MLNRYLDVFESLNSHEVKYVVIQGVLPLSFTGFPALLSILICSLKRLLAMLRDYLLHSKRLVWEPHCSPRPRRFVPRTSQSFEIDCELMSKLAHPEQISNMHGQTAKPLSMVESPSR